MTHTPGPWTIIPARPYDGDEEEFEGGYTSPASIEGDDGNPVCMFGSAEGSGCLFENEADYHLIAAAPDMLARLEKLSRGAEPMADGGDTPMTAAEEVLAWLLVEKIGVPDDVPYSPDQAQEIIARHLDRANATGTHPSQDK